MHAPTPISALLALALFGPAAAAQNPYQPLIDRWVAQDTAHPRPADAALFIGSSSVRRHEHLVREFADRDVIQRGFGGSTWDDAIEFVEEIVLPYDPAAIFVYEGSNDITQGKSPQDAFADYQTFVGLVRAGQNQGKPPIPIVHIGLVPAPGLWSSWSQRAQYNQLVEAYVEGDSTLFYADMATPFLATGSPPTTTLFSPDMVHLNEAGYEVWTSVLAPLVAALVPAKGYAPNPLHPPIHRRILIDLGPSNFADGGHTPTPGPFGRAWSNWFEVSGLTSSTLSPSLAGQVFAGEHAHDVVTHLGEPTGIELLVTGGFVADGKQVGGLSSPSFSLLGKFAVPEATQDFFYTNGDASPGGLAIKGLHPALRYDVRFFASRALNEASTTAFGLTGKGAEQTASVQASGPGSGAGGYNGNNDTVVEITGVRPDARGQVFLDLRGSPAGVWGYLNALQITVRPGPRRYQAYGTGPTSKP